MTDESFFPPPITTLVANLFIIDAFSRGAGEHSYSYRKVPESVDKALGVHVAGILAKQATVSDISACCAEYWPHFMVVMRDRFTHQPIPIRWGDRAGTVTFRESGNAFTLTVST